MKRAYLTLTSLVVPVAVVACAAQKPVVPAPAPMPAAWSGAAAASPTTAPVLASAATDSSVKSDELPKGHPDIQQLLEQRKAAKTKAKMSGELPAGHPPVSGMPPKAGAAPMQSLQPGTTQPAMFGTVLVRVVQGTANGPAVGQLPATVQLMMGDQELDKRELQTAADGSLRLDNIPLSMNVTPVVKVKYNDVEYTGQGDVMDGARAEQHLQIPVFETTETAPAWNVKMQHVMLDPSVDGVRVTEMLAIENPTDKAWIGKQVPGTDGSAKRRTLAFALPANATDVQFGGALHDCCTTVENGQVFDSMAVVPGVSQYRIGYTLPVKNGAAEVAFATPAAVEHLMVFLPDDGSTVKADGIGDGGVADMGGGKTRFYRAANVAAGTNVKLNLSGITAKVAAPEAAVRPTAARTAGSSAQTAKLVAGVGGLGIFVVGGMLLMFKAPKSAKKA
jgi:hypothetical protein